MAPRTPKSGTKPSDENLPKFDPVKFSPGYVPRRVSHGNEEYNIVYTGVPDTGLCGNYWNLPEGEAGRGKRRSKLRSPSVRRASTPAIGTFTVPHPPQEQSPGEPTSVVQAKEIVPLLRPSVIAKNPQEKFPGKSVATSVTVAMGGQEESTTKAARESRPKKIPANSGDGRGIKRKLADTEDDDDVDDKVTSTARISLQQKSEDDFAAYESLKWESLVRPNQLNLGVLPDAVQHAVVLRPPHHLVSLLRINGFNNKGLSHTNSNIMVATMLEGEVIVLLPSKDVTVRKGDSFFIPPKTPYNIMNQSARDAELSLVQYRPAVVSNI